ncbi:MAG: hypothetical protein FXV79_02730 [Candidatus Thioglobus sp.]|nr:MAG: hypothetical protein FXV80_03715 [Candidatus Thioglobus sp.]KAA0451164.1 MAG: hypothetical protein FXV79_02730 [Candidatus Thioglobus sp.]
MKNISKKRLFYGFVIANIGLLFYAYAQEDFLSPVMIKSFLTGRHFLLTYAIFILILIVRGLTLIPGTAFIITGVYLFATWQVYLAIQIAIICYCLIIYNFAHKLNFKVPQKILDYEHKIKTKEIPIIFFLCFIPGISINVLIYFLTIINIKLRNILIGVLAGTCITSIIYISIWKGVIKSADYFI